MDSLYHNVPAPRAVSSLVRGYARQPDQPEAIAPETPLALFMEDEHDLWGIELMLTEVLGVRLPPLKLSTALGDLYACYG